MGRRSRNSCVSIKTSDSTTTERSGDANTKTCDFLSIRPDTGSLRYGMGSTASLLGTQYSGLDFWGLLGGKFYTGQVVGVNDEHFNTNTTHLRGTIGAISAHWLKNRILDYIGLPVKSLPVGS